MKRKILTLLLLFSVTISKGQTTYSISQIPFNPDPFTAGDTLLINIDDIYSPALPLPFSFCFFDSIFDSVVVSSNGYITFDLSVANGTSNWPITAPAPNSLSPDLSVMAPWQDLDPSINSTLNGCIVTSVQGVAPYRRWVLSYYNISMFSNPCNQILFFSQQLILYETTNRIEIFILEKEVCASWNNGAAIMGIQKDSTTAYIVPGRNFPTQWTAFNEGWRFSPNGPCAGPVQGNSISGKLFADNNTNCIYDAGDQPLPNRPILANGGAYYDWTDASGNYTIPVDSGNWVLTRTPPLYWASFCPGAGSYTHYIPGFGTYLTNDDFADTVLFHCTDLLVDIGTPNFTRCLNEWVGVNYCNQGTEADSNAMITVTFADSLTLDSADVPFTSLGGNAFSFNVGILAPGACGHFNLYVSVGCDPVGVVYCMNADITGSNPNDCDTTNNHAQDCHALIASFDPNGKYVASQDFSTNGWVTNETIQSVDELIYMVTFQNTGNDTAYTVRITDTLSTFVDPSTVQPGAASANYNWLVIGNVVIFEFQNIMLPDSNTNEPASHGFVKFKVNQSPGNIDGTHILNSAAIYFDQNTPIMTNETDNFVCQDPPLAAFSFTTSNGTATFTDASTGNTSWSWTFGDLGTSTQQNPVHNYTSSGTYTVTLIVSGSCGNDTTIQSVNVTVTEVNEAMMAAVKVYPNPNSGQFFVELPPNAGKVTLSVTDATGRMIMERIVSTSGRVELNLNDAQGFYFLTIQGENFRKVVTVAVK